MSVVSLPVSEFRGRVTQWHVIVSEWTKLKSVRSTRWSLLIATVLTIGFPILASIVISSHWGSRSPGDRAHFNPLDPALVGSQIAEFRLRAARREPPPRAVVVEVPLLFESGSDHGFDATIAVVADEEVRRRRAARRGHRALRKRGARQLSQEEKAAKSTYVVVNDGDIEELERKLSSVLEMLEG